MAKIIVGTYMVRYPLGGNLSWAMQYLLGFQRLGHEVYVVEKADYPRACFDPVRNQNNNDCSYGIKVVRTLLDRFRFADRWCFVAFDGTHYGLSQRAVNKIFQQADIFVDSGNHGAWNEAARNIPITIFIDGEPAYTQIQWEKLLSKGGSIPDYDYYFTNGLNFGSQKMAAPTAGVQWHPFPNPVSTDIFQVSAPPPDAALTTVMNWQSHNKIEHEGKFYGQKDMEFDKFINLPRLTKQPLEIAVSGSVPEDKLSAKGWRIRSGKKVTVTFDSFLKYIKESRGEFSVCKNIFVATRSGWFSDRSGAYLASGRPVILQDTGFSSHLPCGEGLFAVTNQEEAAAAIEDIVCNYTLHSRRAREIACEHLDSSKLMSQLLQQVGAK